MRTARLALLLFACSAPREPRAVEVHLVGVVHRAPPRVVLETGDGKTWTMSDSADPLLETFDGRRVRVKTLRLVGEDPAAPNVACGPETTLTGWFEEWQWPQGTKLAGEKALRFVTVDGRRFFVAPLPSEPPMGEPMTVRGRVVKPSPFLGGLPGELLWVYDVRARD
jgi:hypothetical protein